MFWNRLFVIALMLLVNLSCSTGRPYNSQHKYCPSFALPEWKPDYLPQHNTLELIDKQKFAIQQGQETLWFVSKTNTIGLCVPPKRNYRRTINDCGTIYVVYSRKDDAWELQEQKVTICP